MLTFSKFAEGLEIVLELSASGGAFIATKDGTKAGEMTFYWLEEAGKRIMVIDHTRVPEAFNGQGIGRRLAMAGAECAQQNELRVRALCPFALKVFQSEQKTKELLI